jgi:hypothetical protein
LDDLFLPGDDKLINESKRNIAIEFKMKDLGMMRYFLGLEVWQRPSEIFLKKGKYFVEILNRFKMMDCKSMPTSMVTNLKLLSETSPVIVDSTMYINMIGLSMYLMNTRPYLCFSVNTLSQYMVELRHVHLIGKKNI